MSEAAPPFFAYHETHLVILPQIEWEEWEGLWGTLRQTDQSISFWLGDALLLAESRWPDRWSQALPTGSRVDRYRTAMWVCSKIQPTRRRATLSYSLHREIAALAPEAQDTWLDRAEANAWSVKDLKAELAAAKARAPGNNGGPPVDDAPAAREEVVPDERSALSVDASPPSIVAGGEETAALRALIAALRVADGPDRALDRRIAAALAVTDYAVTASVEEAIRLKGAGWRATMFDTSAGWQVEFRKGDQLAVGISQGWARAICEAALSARLSDLGAG